MWKKIKQAGLFIVVGWLLCEVTHAIIRYIRARDSVLADVDSIAGHITGDIDQLIEGAGEDRERIERSREAIVRARERVGDSRDGIELAQEGLGEARECLKQLADLMDRLPGAEQKGDDQA